MADDPDHARPDTAMHSGDERGDGYVSWLRSRVGSSPILLNFAAACVVDKNQVLLQLRQDAEAWGLPGGAIELGESAEEAMLREVREETGLDVHPTYLLSVYSNYRQMYPNGDVAQPITIVFRCHIRDGAMSITDPETLALRWFPFDHLPDLWSPLHHDALTDLRTQRQGVFR